MKRLILLPLLCAVLFLSQSYAAIIRVPQDRPTIQLGIGLAETGDSILVFPGYYAENVDFSGKGVYVISLFGPTQTFLIGTVTIENLADRPAELSGFTVDHLQFVESIVKIVNSNPIIANNSFSYNSGGDAIVVSEGGSPTIMRNLFHHNTVGSACIGAVSGHVRIFNNTMDSNSRGFFSLTEETIALNNIVTRSVQYGIHGAFQSLDYNDVWNNETDYEFAEPGDHDLSLNPLYLNSAAADYHLQTSSPCVDAGSLEAEFLDPDGTRNDIGAFATYTSFPVAGFIKVGSANNQRVPEPLPVIAWSFRDSEGVTQHAFDLQIGDVNDLSGATLWSSGEIVSTDTAVIYGGAPLPEGMQFWGRIRVNNGTIWGPWKDFGFRTNQTPAPLIPVFPLSGEILSNQSVSLQVQSGSDPDLDSIDYEFEVFADPGLTQRLASGGAKVSVNGITFSEPIANLQAAQHFWWRARATDGYDFGAWTNAHDFVTRAPLVIRVPQDQSTIQSALNSAYSGDTVLVAPGTYRELLTFPNQDIKLISASGPDVTRLSRPTNADVFKESIRFLTPVSRECEVSGFTLMDETANSFISFDGGAQAVLKGNVFRNLNCGTAMIFTRAGNPLITHNRFLYNHVGWYCIEALALGTVDIIGNTFDHNNRGVFTEYRAATLLNNIISNSAEYGLHGEALIHDYNDIWNNNPDYTDTYAAAHEFSADPQYLDPVNGDVSIGPSSPCVNSGDPRPEFNDPDGSRSDIGAISTDFDFPLALAIAVGESGNLHVVEDTPFITWQYYNLEESWQTRLEVKIGTDPNWEAAELWATGPIYSTTTSVLYEGPAPTPGQLYYGRIRLKDDLNWGGWQDFRFRRNTQPPVPVPISPVNNTPSPWTDTRLVVSRCSDPDLDTVSYQFVVYSDSALNEVVATFDVQADTISESILGLIPLQTYWWAARSFDGYEYSSWTPTQQFRARNGIAYVVPETYPTIQLAIDSAHHGDTVLVAPGTYSESLNLKGKSLTIMSSGGSDVTTIVQEDGSWIGFWPSRTESKSGIIGFTLRDHSGDFCIFVTAGASPTLEDLRFIDNSVEILVYVQNGSPLIRRNLFYHNLVGSACIGVSAGITRIENNTFDGNGRGIFSFSAQTIVRNNILANNGQYGLYGNYGIIDYNLMWRNAPDYVEVTPAAAHELIEYPMFVDTLNLDFRLAPGSPCIDAGDPATIYNDPDGSRNDLGAYPFVQQYPAPFQLLAPENSLSPALLTVTPTLAWSSAAIPNALGALTYTLQIAADSLFGFASLVEVVDTTATLPTPLSWGTRYWWKVQASISGRGDTWSDEIFTFRTHKLGDADGSGRLNITDIVFIINYIFLGGRPPDPLVTGDVNCSGSINIGDAVFLVNYIFGDGPQPCSDFPTEAPLLGPDEATADR